MKQKAKIPKIIWNKLLLWAKLVQQEGIEEARKIKGYHDEPLAGEHKGKRSIRLNQKWRAIYEQDEQIKLYVLEVHPHDY